MLRSVSFATVALAVVACEPDLPQNPPGTVVTAVFDPTTSQIPLPNDLAFFNPLNGVCPNATDADKVPTAPPKCAQAELLASFKGQFPSDQEVPVTVDFVQTSFGNGPVTTSAPDLDFASFTSSTFIVYSTTPGLEGDVPIETPSAADYVKAADHGTLSIRVKGHQPWATGSYVVALRGGPDGIKTKDGTPIAPSQVFALLAQDVDTSDPANIGLLKAQFGSTEEALKQGTQLNILRGLYDLSAFPVVDKRFPRHEVAIATTFKIAPTVTNVTIDPARGLVPLPIDLLRDPATGELSALAACTLAGSSLAADGTCPNPAAAGFQALDGFSTTGAILAPTSELVRAATITKDTLMLFDLSDPANPELVPPTTLIVEPCEFTSSCSSPTALSPVIALQPAGATSADPTSVLRTRPLKDNTDYAVVMTTGILDKAGNPIGPGTVANVVRFTNPVSVGGKSALQGIDDSTAAALEAMRLQLRPVLGKVDASKVAMAYTFHTQTILGRIAGVPKERQHAGAIQLAALPYTTPAATALPGPVTALTPADAFTKYGVLSAIPHDSIDEILEADITTFNLLDPATGAFNPDPAKAAAETIHVLIATPKASNTNVPPCTGDLTPFGKCAPMVIFRHGLGGGRADMLLIANTNAAAGMVTVAIDAAKHGDRSFCTSGTTGAASGCNNGATCTTALPPGAQGDANPPGTCGADGFVKRPVTPGATGNTDGIAAVSGNYLVSANFFRTRDTMRQDLIDESQLVRAIAFAPSGSPPTGHSVFDHVIGRAIATAGAGMIIDPATIYYSSQSLGSVQGAMTVAANPRISKAAFNVGGGTIVDLFTTSPAFAPTVNQLLAGLGIEHGTAQFLQFLVVAKTVLDPADPINFVGHLTANTLPNLLPPLGGNQDGSVPQAAKKVLTQVAQCDGVVPNPTSFLYASNIPTMPIPPTGADGTFQLFRSNDAATPACPTGGAVPHGFLLDWSVPARVVAAQGDMASFLRADTLPPSVRTN